jgi:hypothetical protein
MTPRKSPETAPETEGDKALPCRKRKLPATPWTRIEQGQEFPVLKTVMDGSGSKN